MTPLNHKSHSCLQKLSFRPVPGPLGCHAGEVYRLLYPNAMGSWSLFYIRLRTQPSGSFCFIKTGLEITYHLYGSIELTVLLWVRLPHQHHWSWEGWARIPKPYHWASHLSLQSWPLYMKLDVIVAQFSEDLFRNSLTGDQTLSPFPPFSNHSPA